MTLSLLLGPTAEPIYLSDAKLHLRVDGTAEDGLIDGLIAAARLSVEANGSLALINQTWKWQPGAEGKACARSVYELPLGPVSSITSVTRHGVELAPADFTFSPGLRAQLTLTKSVEMPTSDIEIIFVAGFGASSSDVPRDLRHAVTMLVAQWFENREPVGIGDVGLPAAVAALLAPYRKVRL